MPLLLLFQDAQWWEPSPSSIILAVVTLALTVITYRQRAWRSAAEAAIAEKNVHKETAERLRAEATMLRSEVGQLKGQTDIAPLVQGMASTTNVLTNLCEEIKAQRATSEVAFKTVEDSYRSLTASFIAHTLEDKAAQLEATETRLRLATALNGIEDRLSQVAVRVGMVKWEPLAATPKN